MPAERARKIKSSLTLIEILIVLTIVMSLSTLLMTKGVSFVKNYQIEQEKKVFNHALLSAHKYSNIQNTPVEVSLIYREDKGMVLEISDLKFSKTFKYMRLAKDLQRFTVFPHESVSQKDLDVSFF